MHLITFYQFCLIDFMFNNWLTDGADWKTNCICQLQCLELPETTMSTLVSSRTRQVMTGCKLSIYKVNQFVMIKFTVLGPCHHLHLALCQHLVTFIILLFEIPPHNHKYTCPEHGLLIKHN